MEPFISPRDIAKAICFAFLIGCLFFGPYVILNQHGWYQDMGIFWHKNPIVLADIVGAVILGVVVFTILNWDRTPNEDDES